MDQDKALGMLAGYVAKDGVIDGCARLSKLLAVKPTTILGWWRRESIPEWRLPAFQILDEHLSAKPAKRKAK